MPWGPKVLQSPLSGIYDGLRHKRAQCIWQKCDVVSNPLETKLPQSPRDRKLWGGQMVNGNGKLGGTNGNEKLGGANGNAKLGGDT